MAFAAQEVARTFGAGKAVFGSGVIASRQLTLTVTSCIRARSRDSTATASSMSQSSSAWAR